MNLITLLILFCLVGLIILAGLDVRRTLRRAREIEARLWNIKGGDAVAWSVNHSTTTPPISCQVVNSSEYYQDGPGVLEAWRRSERLRRKAKGVIEIK